MPKQKPKPDLTQDWSEWMSSNLFGGTYQRNHPFGYRCVATMYPDGTTIKLEGPVVVACKSKRSKCNINVRPLVVALTLPQHGIDDVFDMLIKVVQTLKLV